jgi:hypothetical protein
MSRNVHEHKINISELRVIMNYIGIDLGTSAVKLLLMEGSGKILKIVSREYPICFPKPGWSEQNPYDWFTQSMDGLKELLDGTDRSLVAGISFGGQMHGLVASSNSFSPSIDCVNQSYGFCSDHPGFGKQIGYSRLTIFKIFPLPSIKRSLTAEVPRSIPM